MGVRGELFSTRVMLKNRTYFFNVKENRLGDLYLNIVESKNRDEGGFDRQSVILFAEDLQEFLKGFDESLKVLEKSAREKRRGKKSGEEKPRELKPRDQKPNGSRQQRVANDDRPRHRGFKDTERRSRGSGARPPGQRSSDQRSGRDAPQRKKRVVVKKR